MLDQFTEPESEDDCWTSVILSSGADWLVGLPIKVATVEQKIRQQWVDDIQSFIRYLETSLPLVQDKLFEFYNQSLDWLKEEGDVWDYQLPESPSVETLWNTLEGFDIYFKDEFHGGPCVYLCAETDWRPDGGIVFRYENGHVDYVGSPE